MDEKRAAFAAAFDELCLQHPLPPLPYPTNRKKLKRLKWLMKKRMSREYYSRALRAETLVTGHGGKQFLQWEINIHDMRRKEIAGACNLPTEALNSVYALLYG